MVAVGLLTAPAIGVAQSGLTAAEPVPGSRLDSPPASVRLVLPGRVEGRFLTLRVTGPGGETVSGPARRDPRDPRAILASVHAPRQGVLTVTWRVLSQDGHPSGGSYTLGVRVPAGVAPVAEVVRSDHGVLPVLARLLALAGPLGLIGLVALAAGVVAPAIRAGGIVVPGEGAARAEDFRDGARRALSSSARAWWRAWWALVAATAVGVGLGPLALLRGLREGPGALGTLLRDTRVGEAWSIQMCAFAILLITSALMRRALGSRWLPDTPRAGAVLAVGPLAALFAISWGGHASAGGDATLNIAIDLLHSVATAAWIGGLLGLAVLVAPAVARLGAGDRVRLAAAVVVRFSAVAMAAVAVLVVTGVYRALAEVSVDELAHTGYGRVLLVKLGLFVVLLAGGAYNRMVVHPRLERAALGLDPDDRGAASALRISVRAELALAAALLVSVALLVSLPPPG